MKAIYIFFLSLLFTGCCGKYDKYCEEFTQDEINKWDPYEYIDTMLFISNINNDTIYIKKISHNQKTEPIFKRGYVLHCKKNCMNTRYSHYEITDYNSKWPKKFRYFEISLEKFYDKKNDVRSFDCKYYNSDNTFFLLSNSIVIDSLVINNKVIYNVNRFANNSIDSTITIAYSYVKEGIGLIRIDIKNSNEYFERIK